MAPAPVLVEREWCFGLSPISWGLTITAPDAATEVVLRVASPRVRLLSAAPGPGLPEGWSVRRHDDAMAVASGTSPLAVGQRLPALFVVETDRATSEVGARGALPVAWEVSFGGGPPVRVSFPPVMELADALSRGLVRAVARPLSPWGPVELTVDNPGRSPLWLDLPPGSLLTGGGQEWILGLESPYDMHERQKTGRTIVAFPVAPPAGAAPPRGLALEGRLHPRWESFVEVALAVGALQERALDGGRAAGAFESWSRFDFWPAVLRWAAWQDLGAPPRQSLVDMIGVVLAERAAAGDVHAGRLDPAQAAVEVERAVAEAMLLRPHVGRSELPATVQAAWWRFQRPTRRPALVPPGS